jgi:hypothetical protein
MAKLIDLQKRRIERQRDRLREAMAAQRRVRKLIAALKAR